jgi:hypothetical protein
METFGSLLDKLSIETIRLSKLDESSAEVVSGVSSKINILKAEIDDYIIAAVAKKVPIEDPKFKIYKYEKPAGDVFGGIGDAVARLFEANLKLWNLEDVRRDKSVADKDRLAACDDVARWNRVRNDAMDSINNMLKTYIENKNS